MNISRWRPRRPPWIVGAVVGLGVAGACLQGVRAHIVPAEKLHPVAESYRRMTFVMNLNPVAWNLVRRDARRMLDALSVVDPAEAKSYGQTMAGALREGDYRPPKGEEYDSYAA